VGVSGTSSESSDGPVGPFYAGPVPLPLESVPNLSEGRDPDTLSALREAMSAPARLLDVHADADHHRSVYTLVGTGAELVETLASGIGRAVELIDLRRHEGAHPRVGAADVVPLVPLIPEHEPAACGAALELADRIAELELPVFFYGRLTEDRREPAFFRRGGTEELQRRVSAGELEPDRGPKQLHPKAGAVLVGVRRPLIAFNVNLRADDVEVAREIARMVRERDGGFPGVRALGLDLPSAGLVQVSMNVTDWEASALHEIVERIVAEAHARNAEVVGSELVGLMPAGAAVEAAGAVLRIDGFDSSRVLELRLLGE
jgi:glutamate formiminotransferase